MITLLGIVCIGIGAAGVGTAMVRGDAVPAVSGIGAFILGLGLLFYDNYSLLS